MNGISYYYVCNGMANADHGYAFDFSANHRLEGLQHWRVAINALQACEANGYDATDTMYNSVITSCCIPVMNQWRPALAVLRKLIEEDRKPHAVMVENLSQCLIRNARPKEASRLLKYAGESGIAGYDKYLGEANVFDALPDNWGCKANGESDTSASIVPSMVRAAPRDGRDTNDSDGSDQMSPRGRLEESDESREQQLLDVGTAGLRHEQRRVFRPRVYRQLWYKWHAIANRYRPTATLRKRQLAPKDSPCGIPAFYRL